ncbi:hypothetical protein [Bacillus thuringiensis]|uniref:hypothetical protein n=1 Tax=Bacillus thuringiensis TaxID=1428 RepID=UPI002AB5AF04|nr:hypothetical protein [Bacillus thuringiensis]MDY7965616.1 hypothetical protein [Bacillus thuringiensis]
MNENQRNDGKNNGYMPDKYVDYNLDVSCGCGCQQNKNDCNQYISNEQTQNHERMRYSVANEVKGNDMYNSVKRDFREHDMYHENKNYYSCSSTQFNTINLPEVSKRFQTIQSTENTTDTARVLSAMNTRNGQTLDPSDANLACRTIRADNTVLNELLGISGIAPEGTQDFLFYQLDSGNFIIANKGNGRVLEVKELDEHNLDALVTISNDYSPSNGNQRFRLIGSTSETFRLATEALPSKQIDICGGYSNSYTLAAANRNTNQPNALFRIHDTTNLEIPTLRSGGMLGSPPVLTSLSDAGPSPEQAQRVIIGSALIPCLYVNDVLPLDRRMKESPYYVLEYRQYWHRLWTDEIPSGDTRPFEEITGILSNAQTSMRNMIDMTIGADWGLRFGDNSLPFKRGILDSLNTLGSFADVDLGNRITPVRHMNYNPFPARYARFVRAHEYRLTRLNGTLVVTPWVALDYRSPHTSRFPLNAQFLQNYKIISSDNSYDLPVLEHTDDNKKW